MGLLCEAMRSSWNLTLPHLIGIIRFRSSLLKRDFFLLCPDFRGFMLEKPNLWSLVKKGRVGKLSNLRLVHPNPQILKATGYDSRAVVFDAILCSLLILKVYPLVAKKVRGFAPIVLVSIVLATLFYFAQRDAAVIADVQSSTTPSKLATITETIKAAVAPSFQRPIAGATSQNYWLGHQGIDIPNPYGATVRPIAAGKVEFAGWDTYGYGYTIVIRHLDGFASRYAHLAGVGVQTGAEVGGETLIGYVGASGVATGAHLHLEVYWNSTTVDPDNFLPTNYIN